MKEKFKVEDYRGNVLNEKVFSSKLKEYPVGNITEFKLKGSQCFVSDDCQQLANKKYPCIVYLDGTGFMAPKVAPTSCIAKILASQTNLLTIVPDELPAAPEQDFEAQINVIVRFLISLQYQLHEGGHDIDPQKMMLVGYCSGATLAFEAAIKLAERNKPSPIQYLFMYEPLLDFKFHFFDASKNRNSFDESIVKKEFLEDACSQAGLPKEPGFDERYNDLPDNFPPVILFGGRQSGLILESVELANKLKGRWCHFVLFDGTDHGGMWQESKVLEVIAEKIKTFGEDEKKLLPTSGLFNEDIERKTSVTGQKNSPERNECKVSEDDLNGQHLVIVGQVREIPENKGNIVESVTKDDLKEQRDYAQYARFFKSSPRFSVLELLERAEVPYVVEAVTKDDLNRQPPVVVEIVEEVLAESEDKKNFIEPIAKEDLNAQLVARQMPGRKENSKIVSFECDLNGLVDSGPNFETKGRVRKIWKFFASHLRLNPKKASILQKRR